jgi:selenide,water dikinase
MASLHSPATVRLTSFASGGGCACKIPPGELEDAVRGLSGQAQPGLLVGLDTGDDAAVSVVAPGIAVVATADFFTPVVDDPYDWGRIAAANALSDVYAMGGRPVLAVNLLSWPREKIPFELAREVLRGGLDIAAEAGCVVGGGHSIDDPEPKYGMAVTGVVDPDRLLRNDAGQPGMPLTLTKPLGLGILNNRHKATGERFADAIDVMTMLNAAAAGAAVAAGATTATDVTGFGLLGHLHKLARASGCAAVIEAAAVPYLDGARPSAAGGYIPGGSRRNLDWVRPHLRGDRVAGGADELELLLLADAQTSGGLLVGAELAGHPVVGELVDGPAGTITIR